VIGARPDQSSRWYRIGTVAVIGRCGIEASNGGNLAFRNKDAAAAFSRGDPELPTTTTSVTWPDGSTVKRTVTVPSSPRRRASSG